MSATDQPPLHDKNGNFAKGNNPPTGFHTNPERRNPGGWRKADTPRYKLEQMMKMSDFELQDIKDNLGSPTFERKLAGFILDGDWKTIREMTDQVYGQPKQTVDTTVRELPVVLAPVNPKDLDATNNSVSEDS